MKKGLIFSTAAYFDPCKDCRNHGSIVSGEKRSSEFVSKEQGLEVIESGVRRGFIAKDEVGEVKRQVESSNLPRRTEDAEPPALIMALLRNYVYANPEILERLKALLEGEPTFDKIDDLAKALSEDHPDASGSWERKDENETIH